MAKNFNNSAMAKTIKDVAKVSAEKAQVIVVKMINNDCLIDYPKNNEDIQDTLDLENSIKELGFVDPIEVTAFGQEKGKFMIVSGHRRRSAGVKCGINTFPCIVKTFNDESGIQNYVLLANSQRDSSKDPLLFCKRYKMHEEYLKSIGFKGKLREEIAKRLGISVPQADRYKNMNKIILPVWDMVRDEIVGMSSVMPLASHDLEEQLEIYNIMQDTYDKNINLTRDTVKKIIENYREEKNNLENKILEKDNKKLKDKDSNDLKINKSDESINQIIKNYKIIKNQKENLSSKQAENMVYNLSDVMNTIIDEMYNISKEHNIKELFDIFIEDIKNKINKY